MNVQGDNQVEQGENGIELGVPEAVRRSGLSVRGIEDTWNAESRNPMWLPRILLLHCNLEFRSQDAGFFKKCAPSDVCPRRNRLLIPVADAKKHILGHGRTHLDRGVGIPIRVYLKNGRFFRLLFKRISDGKYTKYIITHRERAPQMPRWRSNELSLLIAKREVER